MFKQQSPFPTRKVWGATTMAALAVIVLTALAAYFIPPAEIDGIRSTQSKPI